MKVVSAHEMQKIDRITIDEAGFPAEVLMGFAGKSVADYISSSIKPADKIAVFCGTGNNGGDGFVAAYSLLNKSFYVDIFIAGNISKISKVSRIYLDICLKCKINITELSEDKLREINLDEYDLIVDAMLGTGFSGNPRGIIKESIIKINGSGRKILSIDLPSGLPSDGKAPEGEAIKADCTFTIGLPKISLVTHPGAGYTGELHICDIGFPAALTNSPELTVDLLCREYVKPRLTFSRDADSHKGSAGHILLVGGFDNMEGAIMMSAMSAFEAGTGLVSLLTTKRARKIIAGRIPELITRTLDSFDTFSQENGVSGKASDEISSSAFLSNKSVEKQDREINKEIKDFLKEKRYNAMIIGPGMGRTELSFEIFYTIIDNIEDTDIKKVLIDGDGLYHLADYLENGKLPEGVSFVLTPHFSEASSLFGKTIDEIKNARLNSTVELAKKISSVVLLKGPLSIASDGKNSLINTTGNPALGTAGSGDILSGIIGSLLLKDMSTLDAAGIGAYIHGLAADLCVLENKLPVLKATDIVKYIRKAFAECVFE